MWLFYINSQVTLIPTTFSIHGHNIMSVCVISNDNFVDNFSFSFFFDSEDVRSGFMQGLQISRVYWSVNA